MDADKIKLTPELLAIHNILASGADSLSGVGAPAALPLITNELWELLAESVEQKQELAAYAKERGIRFTRGAQLDPELGLAWNEYIDKVYCFSSREIGREKGFTQVTVSQFKAMCDAYAAAR